MGCRCAKPTPRITETNIRSRYKIGRLCGSGAFGDVRECVDRETQEVYAVKITQKNSQETNSNWSNENMFRSEVEILQILDHPNVIRFYDFYEDRHFLYAVIEKCDGGELFEQVLRRKQFNEADASVLCKQMLLAMQHLHSKNIVHRDIKAENFMFKTKDIHSPLKLIDFGMSAEVDANRTMTDVCGSPHYLSPELIRRNYNQKADMWALGILIYLLLFGRYPFDGSTTNLIIREIISKKVSWKRGNIEVSYDAVDFMKHLINRCAIARYSADEALRHTWITRIGVKDAEVPKGDLMEAVRSAQRKVSIERPELPIKEIEMRQKLLSLLEEEWAAGLQTGVRLSQLNISQEHTRHYKRSHTVPPIRKQVNIFNKTDSDDTTRRDKQDEVNCVNDIKADDEVEQVIDNSPNMMQPTRVSLAETDDSKGGSTHLLRYGYSQFVRGKKAYTMDYVPLSMEDIQMSIDDDSETLIIENNFSSDCFDNDSNNVCVVGVEKAKSMIKNIGDDVGRGCISHSSSNSWTSNLVSPLTYEDSQATIVRLTTDTDSKLYDLESRLASTSNGAVSVECNNINPNDVAGCLPCSV